MKNYLRLKSWSIAWVSYIFIDTAELLYTRLVSDKGVRIKSIREYQKAGSGLRLIICRVLKRDTSKFEEMIPDIRNKALLLGYVDYDDACAMLSQIERGETSG